MFIKIFLGICIFVSVLISAESYDNFKAAIYARAYEVDKMKDIDWLRERFDIMEKYIKVSKVYLETHRDLLIVDKETISHAKKFFSERGIETAGGITLTVDESNRFETFCYTNPEHRKKAFLMISFSLIVSVIYALRQKAIRAGRITDSAL